MGFLEWKITSVLRHIYHKFKKAEALLAFKWHVPKSQIVHKDAVRALLCQETSKTILYDILFSQGGRHGGGEWGKSVLMDLLSELNHRNNTQLFIAMDPEIMLDQVLLKKIKTSGNRVKIIPVSTIGEIRNLVNLDLFSIFFTPAIVVYAENYTYMQKAGSALNFRTRKTRIIAPLLDIRDYDLAEDFEKIFAFRKSLGCGRENKASIKEYQIWYKQNERYRSELKQMYKDIIANPSIETIITLSQYCKDRMQHALETNISLSEKIIVLYPEMKIPSFPNAIKGSLDFSRIKFILANNIGRKEKNGAAVARAMDELASEVQFSEYYFVLTGIRNLEELDINIQHKSRFVVFNVLPPANLEYLYQKASCLVFATQNEGFGLPPLEAMHYNTPCVVSKVTALPEVYEDAVVYCDPFNISSIVEGMKKAITAPPQLEIRKGIYQKIRKRQQRDKMIILDLLFEGKAAIHEAELPQRF